MKTTLLIAQNDLRVFLKEKSGYAWLFVMPLVFIYFFGIAMRGSDREPSGPRPTVAIENHDTGYLGTLLVDQLEAEGLRVVDSAEEKHPDRSIQIPENFTSSVQDAETVNVSFTQTRESGSEPAAMLEVRLTRAILGLTSAIFSIVSSDPPRELNEANVRAALAREPKVLLDSRFAGRRKIPTGFDQSVPGYIVMFVLMNLLIFGGLSISSERTNGVLKRMAMNPVRPWQLILGKILGRFFLGVVQIAYLLIVSRLLFGMHYGNLPLTLMLLATFAWGCAALGVFVGAVIKTPEIVQGVCTLFSVALAALGGCWWPLEIVPDAAQRVGGLFPTAWMMHGLHQLISFGGGWPQIQTSWLLTASFACIATLLAARFLRLD